MSVTAHGRTARLGRILVAYALTVMLAGCTFIPRGTAALRREAVQAGQPFAKMPRQRRFPRLRAVPSAGQLIRRALLNSPDVEAAYWQWRAAIEAIPQRGTEATVPAIGTTVGMKNGVASQASTMLQLANMSSAPIEWPSKPRAAARAALQRAYAAGWRYRRAQFAVRRQTLDAWYQLVADSTMLTLLRRDAALLRELDEFVQAQIRTGRSSPSAALSIANERTGLAARIAAAEAQRTADRAALNRILGRSVLRPLGVPAQLAPSVPPVGSLSRGLAEAVQGNPDLMALRGDIRAGRIDVELARMHYIPDFSLTAASSLDGMAQNLGGALMFPFVRYRAIQALIRQRRDELRQQRAQLRSHSLSLMARLVADLEISRSDCRQIGLYERVWLPRLRQLARFARAEVAQDRSSPAGLVRIARTRVQTQELLLALRLDQSERRADLEALTAMRLGAD